MSSEQDLGPQLSERLAYLLKRAQLELDGLHEENLAPYDISARELAVLLLLDAREPESQQQAGKRLGVDRTTMVALIDALENKGLVVRQPDAEDRRRNVIALTRSGSTRLRQATRASDQAEQRLLAELDEAESAQLRGLLRRIAIPRRDR
jgi:DNA-binding MarR family transcriptional regulator